MQSSLKKSLYLGLAALSFVAAAGVATTSASAASKATLTTPSTTFKTAGSARNVVLTGTNAIYTKPGTVKGAKVVATTTTAKRLSESKKGLDNFRAYRYAVTNRGSLYLKVVSFDGDYRGWVYAGKDATAKAFAGGVKSVDTFTEGTPTTSQTENFYAFKTPAAEAGGKANYAKAGTSVTYKEAAWTQYKVGRAVTSTANDANVKDLIVSKVGTRTAEGDSWVYVTSASTPSVDGWILESSLTKTNDKAVSAADGVTLNYVESGTGTKRASAVVALPADNTLNYVDSEVTTNAPKGYSTVNINGQTTDVTVAKAGTYNVYVNANATFGNISLKAVDAADLGGRALVLTNAKTRVL
ncbi:hypothetical protein C5L31_000636 [Secundilactobacillus malefermentans]|uniref:S-layer protein n=1 Tax=Secundilactobacillus malefermentans TaxID=176292 RepID=A0A4R5NFB1_9LACO|nr:hypothetical protein [Secundilactobacillus malefermentans]TDG72626.1 hypothetical protein C5L31_000636 [Secundilactobacillus malefermentans]